MQSATVGIENAGGNIGLPVAFNAAYVANNLAVLFQPPAAPCAWLTAAPTTGTTNAGANSNVTVTLNTAGLAPGNLVCNLVISSNDPDENPVTVPLNLAVTANLSAFNSIQISDANEFSRTLYFSTTLDISADREQFRLSPVPSAQEFDARYSDDTFFSKDASATIKLQPTAYPVTIRALRLSPEENIQYVIEEIAAGEVLATHFLKEGESIEINDRRVKMLRLGTFDGLVPTEFLLFQNFPNPFNPITEIRYALPRQSEVNLAIFNLRGQKVKTLVSAKQEAGFYQVSWDATSDAGTKVASGLYIYRIEAGPHLEVKKLMLMK